MHKIVEMLSFPEMGEHVTWLRSKPISICMLTLISGLGTSDTDPCLKNRANKHYFILAFSSSRVNLAF